MSTAHEQQQRNQILSSHVRHGRTCAACGQSWKCTPYRWASGERVPRRPTGQRVAVAVVALLVVAGAVSISLLPDQALMALFLAGPVFALAALLTYGLLRRRP